MAPHNFPDSPLVAHVRRLWLHGFLMGLGVVLVIFLLWFLIWGWPFTSGPEESPAPSEIAVPSAPATPAPPAALPPAQTEAVLKTELRAFLARLGEAQQKKDLPLLLSLYSPDFPDLQQKAQEISRAWATYDYPSLRFRIGEIRSQDPENIMARVTWEVESRNRATRETKHLTKTYLVWFAKDAGQWRIRGLEKTS